MFVKSSTMEYISFKCVTFPFATKLLFVTFLMTNYCPFKYSVQVLFVDKLPVGFRDLAQFRSLFSKIVNPPYCQVSLVSDMLSIQANTVIGWVLTYIIHWITPNLPN